MNEAGIPVIKCLQAATIVNSKILSVDDEIGQIKEGFTADIIATRLDPTKDVKTLENVIFVMKDGKVYKN
jgi:imidazolonepropionase-like amidohydrolase